MSDDSILWAITTSNLPVKLLAVVGSAAVGAFAVGWVIQLTAASFGQKVPRTPLWILRGLGGLAVGWLVVKLWLFAGGGGGFGGPGGMGIGAGEGTGGVQKADDVKKNDKKEKETPQGEGDTLRVEVLGDEPLKKLAKSANFDAARRYRLSGERDLRTLDEVKDLIRQRRSALARVEIILYKDSPTDNRPQVADLAAWARDLDNEGKGRLKVDFSEPDRYAPVQ